MLCQFVNKRQILLLTANSPNINDTNGGELLLTANFSKY